MSLVLIPSSTGTPPHPPLQNRHSVILKAFAFLDEYATVRCGGSGASGGGRGHAAPTDGVGAQRTEAAALAAEAAALATEAAALAGARLASTAAAPGAAPGATPGFEARLAGCALVLGRAATRALLEQEAAYNLGRGMHTLDLGHLAVPW